MIGFRNCEGERSSPRSTRSRGSRNSRKPLPPLEELPAHGHVVSVGFFRSRPYTDDEAKQLRSPERGLAIVSSPKGRGAAIVPLSPKGRGAAIFLPSPLGAARSGV